MSAPRRPPRRPTAGLGGRATVLDQWWLVAFAGLDPVAAAVRRPPGPAPGHRLGAVRRPSLTVMGDHAEAAAGQRKERLGVGRSWHGYRIRKRCHGASRSRCRLATPPAKSATLPPRPARRYPGRRPGRNERGRHHVTPSPVTRSSPSMWPTCTGRPPDSGWCGSCAPAAEPTAPAPDLGAVTIRRPRPVVLTRPRRRNLLWPAVPRHQLAALAKRLCTTSDPALHEYGIRPPKTRWSCACWRRSRPLALNPS